MDDDLQQLEAELKRLRPAVPTRDFLARIERELATPSVAAPGRRVAPLWWLWAGVLPAAAAFVVLIGVVVRKPQSGTDATSPPESVAEIAPPEETSAPFKPVAAENVLYASQDEGLITLEDGTPARRERLNYVDTITWKNPRTNASVRWTMPREEVRVIPVKFQ